MLIGYFGGDTAGRTIDDVVAAARAAEQDGFSTYAMSQIFGARSCAANGTAASSSCR